MQQYCIYILFTYICNVVAFTKFYRMKPNEMLQKHNLKCTGCREGIISIMMDSKHALSENEIKEKLSEKYDRTTFYRSFKILQQNKIIHKIVVDNQLIKYALDNPVDNKNHAHFFCHECQSVKCLNSIAIEQPPLPEGFSCTEAEMVMKGTCDTCQK